MIKEIKDNFCGVLNILNTQPGAFDSHFTVSGNLVTIIPLTDEARKEIHKLSYNDGSNEKEHWIYGYSDANTAIAILQKSHMQTGFSSGIDLNAGYFKTPLIVHGSSSQITDVSHFEIIEFYGGIMDVLHVPGMAIERNLEDKKITYANPEKYTSRYKVTLDGKSFDVVITIKVSFPLEITVPDLRNEIHSVLRFEFDSPQPLSEIQRYYRYALNLFQFCSARLNVGMDIRLYQLSRSNPIYVKLNDGFSDYANDTLNFTQVIRLGFLDDKFSRLFQLLNDEQKKPYLLFLPSTNKYINRILYTDANDLCVSFEREYSKQNKKNSKEVVEEAKKLTDKLLNVIKEYSGDNPEAIKAVKSKAENILNSQLVNFSPSLREKICYFYSRYASEAKSITQLQGHDELGITKFYSDEEFENKIRQFIQIRNKASHAGIIWNGGEEIFIHLKLLVYYSILERAGFPIEKISCMLSWLYGRNF